MRVMLVYGDGKTTYAGFNDEPGSEPYFELSRQRYTVDEIAKTGAHIATNNKALLKRFNELGISARPTSKQYFISLSVQESTKERMHKAAKDLKRSVSDILEEQAIKWLDKNGY